MLKGEAEPQSALRKRSQSSGIANGAITCLWLLQQSKKAPSTTSPAEVSLRLAQITLIWASLCDRGLLAYGTKPAMGRSKTCLSLLLTGKIEDLASGCRRSHRLEPVLA